MITKHRTLVAALVVLLACLGCGREQRGRHYEKAGGFSYDPPEDWEITELPGFKYRIATGPPENDFAPNINIVDEQFQGTLEEYADLNMQYAQNLFEDMTVLAHEEFTTRDGMDGIKVVADNKLFGRMLRQVFYHFESRDRMFVVTCSVPVEKADNFDDLFDRSMKTFRFH